MECNKDKEQTGGLCPAAAISAVAAAIAEGRNTKEIALLAAMFVQLGDTLETIAAARECENNGD